MNRLNIVTIRWHTLTHHFDSDVMAKKKQDNEWHEENNAIIRTGGIIDCFFKAVLKKIDSKEYQLRVYGLNEENIVTIPLQTSSEKKAKQLADAYIDSVNTINNGTFDEFDMH